MPVFISNNKVGRTYITMDCYMPVGMRPCVSAVPCPGCASGSETMLFSAEALLHGIRIKVSFTLFEYIKNSPLVQCSHGITACSES